MSTPTEPLTFGQQAALLACEYADEYVTAEAEKAITEALIAAYQRGRADERERCVRRAYEVDSMVWLGQKKWEWIFDPASQPGVCVGFDPLGQSERPGSRGKAE